MYKKLQTESWLRVPVQTDELKLLNSILKREKKTLKSFVNESIRKRLTRETLII